MECERHDGSNINESVAPSTPPTMVDRIRSLLPPPLAMKGTSSYGHHTHRSVNHLSKEISESSSILSSSEITADALLSLPCDRTTSQPHSVVGDTLQNRDESLHTNRVKCYDEGLYLYTSDVIMKEKSPNTNGARVTSATTILETDISRNYATAQSCIRAEKYSDAILIFEVTLNLLQNQQQSHQYAEDGAHTIDTPLMQHIIYHNMAYCYYNCSQHDMAMAYYQMSLQVAELYNFDNLIHIAAAQNALAVLLLQKHQQASENNNATTLKHHLYILRQCHYVYVQTFGLHSKEAVTIQCNIGRILVCVGEYESAIAAFEHCLHARRHLFNGGNNFVDGENVNLMDIAVCMHNIGQAYHQMGESDKAMEWYQQFLQVVGGTNTRYSFHPDVAKTIMSMAEIYMSKDDTKHAILQYEYIIEQSRIFYGTMNDERVIHSNIITAHSKLGDIRAKKREYQTALNHYVQSFQLEQDLFRQQTSQHPYSYHQQQLSDSTTTMIVTLFKIADVQRKLKLCCSAVQIYMRLYEIHIQTHGPYSLEIGRILSYIGSTLYDDHKYSLALEFFFDAFKVQMIYHSYKDTVEAATTLNSIGLIYFLRQQYTSAELCFTESLRINIKLFGCDHYDNSILWYNIASTNYEQGFHDKAITFYEAAIRIEALQSNMRLNGMDDNTTPQRRKTNTRSLQKLGSIYEKQAELQMARDSYLKALRIELSLQCQQNIPTIARLLNVVGNLYLQEAEITPMMECYTTAARLLQQHNLSNDRTCSDVSSVRSGRNSPNDCALIITGYKYYYLSRMYPSAAATA
jgi:tetratricopeptide (TPR) repeat protein